MQQKRPDKCIRNARLQRPLDDYVELAQPFPTHFNRASNSSSHVDWFYSSSPSWIFTLVSVAAHVEKNLQLCDPENLSDHVVMVTITQCSPVLVTHRPIHPEVIRNKLFASVVAAYENAADLENMSTIARWELHKDIIRESVRVSRDDLLLRLPDSKFTLLVTVVSISRAAAVQDRCLAARLIRHSPMAAKHLLINGSRIALRNPKEFAQLYDLTMKVTFGISSLSQIVTNEIDAHTTYSIRFPHAGEWDGCGVRWTSG